MKSIRFTTFALSLFLCFVSCTSGGKSDKESETLDLRAKYDCAMWEDIAPTKKFGLPLSIDMDSIVKNCKDRLYFRSMLLDIYRDKEQTRAEFITIVSYSTGVHLDLAIDDEQQATLRNLYNRQGIVYSPIIVKINDYYKPKFNVRQLINEVDPLSSEIVIEDADVVVLKGQLIEIVVE